MRSTVDTIEQARKQAHTYSVLEVLSQVSVLEACINIYMEL